MDFIWVLVLQPLVPIKQTFHPLVWVYDPHLCWILQLLGIQVFHFIALGFVFTRNVLHAIYPTNWTW